MAEDINIPSDVAEHCSKASVVLARHVARLEYLHELWADEDPDPENGHFWHVKIKHPQAAQIRADLALIAEFLNWLSAFSDNGEGRA